MFDDFDDDLMDEDDEAVTVTAQTEGLPPPRLMPDLLGFGDLEKKLLEMTGSARMPHALIFSGPQGIGKATTAFRLTRYLLKHGLKDDNAGGGLFGEALPKEEPQNLYVSPEDRIFSQVASGGHPDLLVIERLMDDKTQRRKSTVEVDEVRRITPFLRMTASMGGWRIVIVDDADTMNRSAQNAILKILEEPPPNTLLILIAHRIGAMIPTIRSRCRTLHFTTPDRDTFATLIRRNHGSLSDTEINTLYAIAGGSVGQGLRIADEGGLEAIDKIVTLMQNWPHWPWSQIHTLAEAVARPGQEESLRVFQDVMLWIVNTMLHAKARKEALAAPLNNQAAQNLLAAYSLNGWIEIAGQIQEHFDMVARASLDKRHAVLGAFSLFEPKEAA